MVWFSKKVWFIQVKERKKDIWLEAFQVLDKYMIIFLKEYYYTLVSDNPLKINKNIIIVLSILFFFFFITSCFISILMDIVIVYCYYCYLSSLLSL